MRITIDYDKYDALCKRDWEPNYIDDGSKKFLKTVFRLMAKGGFWNKSNPPFPDTDEVEVVLSTSKPVRQEILNIDSLKKLAVDLQERIDKFPVESKDSGERLLRTQLIYQLRSLRERIEQKKEVLLYGEFVPGKEPKVILYMGNIQYSQQLLISTCIHELFHAWNYFRCGRTARAIPEIDEAMVEYATLVFLDMATSIREDELDETDNLLWHYHRNFFLDFHLRAVKDKQESIGLLPAYGFGAYLYETDDKDHSLLLAYPPLSGLLSMNNHDVAAAVSLVNPLYPYGKEEETKQHIINALVPGQSVSVPKDKESQLFQDIIDCPNSCKESNPKHPCYKVLSVQKNLHFRQVPEPWNGDLSKASFILFGSNPALDVTDAVKSNMKKNPAIITTWMEHEVFPSKDQLWNKWQVLTPTNCNCFSWDPNIAKDYFVNRFNNFIFKPLGTPFVDIAGMSTLRYAKSNGIVYPHVLKNDYWKTYNSYCKAFDPCFVPYSFVVTDFVHCKSGVEFGVRQAFRECKRFTGRILDLFINNGLPKHSILIIGANQSSLPKRLRLVFDELSNFGARPAGSPVSIGRNNKGGDIFVQHLQSDMGDIDVYYNIPAPSGRTKDYGPVTLFPDAPNQASISW